MIWKKEWKVAALLVGAFLLCFYLPVEQMQAWGRLKDAVWESLYLVRWYAQAHVLSCLVPAFFIAGAIGVFLSQGSVMKYLGPGANKIVAYGVASISGTVLAVCSCTVLPLFGGIYRMGAGLGPACAFLYAGPAINALAIILTARILGFELGIARAIGAVLFSVVIGFFMHILFRGEEAEKAQARATVSAPEASRSLSRNVVIFAALVGILVFANWGAPGESTGFWARIYAGKWIATGLCGLVLAWAMVVWMKISRMKVALSVTGAGVAAALFPHAPMISFVVATLGLSWAMSSDPGEGGEWFAQSWGFAKQIAPLLLVGVWVSGFLLGRPGHEGLIPSAWVTASVGGNSLSANFCAAFAGAFMYFATLTEVPILQGLIGAGMGKGPALALLLAGPALSLPSMLALRSLMGTKRTIAFTTLVVVMATAAGMIYGALF